MSSSSSTRSQTAIPDIESQELKVQNKVEESSELKSSQHEVTLEHHEHPQSLSIARKWLIVLVISSSALCVTCASSAASFTEDGVSETFHVSHEVTILAISLFVEGLGLGPLLAGPLSEVYGRNIIYRVSFVLLFAFSFGVAFAPNIVVYLVFRFITGFCGSTFLSVAGGSVSDLFDNKTVANPMAVYTISPFIGPVVGPLLSGFINQNTNWRWTYYTLIIWTFTQTFALFVFIPETYVPVLRKRKAVRLRKSTGDNRYFAPLEKSEINLAQAILISCYKPFQLVLYDRMALLLNTWTSLILGILYLAFQAFPVIFETNHGFNMQDTGLAFLGIGIGMLSGLASQPYWNRVYAREAEKNGGVAPPEARLYMGEIGGILTPFGLYFLAFTTYPSVHWIVPIIASVFFGAGIYFVFTCVFTYLVTAYRPIAASAMASNSAMRSTFAAVFPLFAGYMYDGLGTVGATALLAGVMTLTVPLPFVYRRIGPRLRAKSKFAVA
ncbi:major facilitator superfamily domain-containing protein [Lentinula detonsa]|uniref:Major facilitator superfamily domain-containing protein n=1 Tax=Lentinula detonsa TaxID=2804962 RepID=A0A9W8U0H0_9AGAR|nr:major facilitator superfamily domain-containing protein [Lentinula detonsa]KAJ3985794.1 major facilitator superfamily domain-containing protein [Lentinula detonsa]